MNGASTLERQHRTELPAADQAAQQGGGTDSQHLPYGAGRDSLRDVVVGQAPIELHVRHVDDRQVAAEAARVIDRLSERIRRLEHQAAIHALPNGDVATVEARRQIRLRVVDRPEARIEPAQHAVVLDQVAGESVHVVPRRRELAPLVPGVVRLKGHGQHQRMYSLAK